MTESSENPTPSEPTPAWGSDPGDGPDAPKSTAATALLDSIRDAIDDIAIRATPAVREVGARAAELTADVATKAAPYARKAGDATADASAKLAERSKSWAAGVRAAMDAEGVKITPDDTDAAGPADGTAPEAGTAGEVTPPPAIAPGDDPTTSA
jgi:hypothetical protein